MDLAPARSMITAQEYWSREGMSLVLYDMVHWLESFFVAAKLRYRKHKLLNIIPVNNSKNKVIYYYWELQYSSRLSCLQEGHTTQTSLRNLLGWQDSLVPTPLQKKQFIIIVSFAFEKGKERTDLCGHFV